MDQTMDTVSRVAMQNDRWLFVAVMTLLMWFAWRVINHLVKQNEQSRTAHLLALETVVKDSAAGSVLLRECVERNSDAMQQNSSIISSNTVVLERCLAELKHIEGRRTV